MKVIYDVNQTGKRYMSTDDMLFEARLLGLSDDTTMRELSIELARRGLDSYSMGRLCAKADA